ncbi:MAG: cache domain-containing protein, partial [Candidatus Brocadiaceae bacterium]|nr:cache domain-containing protein [Candidatus Brocadiaceae bacterium]
MRLISKLPITTKLLIILLLISILPLFIIIYGFYSLGKAKLTEQTIHVLEVQSKNVAATIDHFIDYRFKHLYRIANIPQLTRILKLALDTDRGNVKDLPSTPIGGQPHIPHQTISSLRAKLRIDPDFLSFSLMDAEGNVVLSTGNTPTIDFGSRPFFFEAVKGEKYVSAPSLDEGKPSIYFSIPIKHTNKLALDTPPISVEGKDR